MTRIANPSGRPHNGQLSTLDVPPRLGHVAIVTVRPSTSPAVLARGSSCNAEPTAHSAS